MKNATSTHGLTSPGDGQFHGRIGAPCGNAIETRDQMLRTAEAIIADPMHHDDAALLEAASYLTRHSRDIIVYDRAMRLVDVLTGPAA